MSESLGFLVASVMVVSLVLSLLMLGVALAFVGQMRGVRKRVQEVGEELGRKRHTNATDAGLLDVIAQINHIEFNLAEEAARNETSRRLIEDARRRIGEIRKGPYSYDKDQPGLDGG